MGNQAPLSNVYNLNCVTLFVGSPERLTKKRNSNTFYIEDEEEALKSLLVQKPGRIINHENQ
jgi:hypothetical protein